MIISFLNFQTVINQDVNSREYTALVANGVAATSGAPTSTSGFGLAQTQATTMKRKAIYRLEKLKNVSIKIKDFHQKILM